MKQALKNLPPFISLFIIIALTGSVSPLPAGELKEKIETIRDIKKGIYRITCKYPVFTGKEKNQAIEKLNALIADRARTRIQNFKSQVSSKLPDALEYTLDLSISVSFPAENIASILFDSSQFTGGAHPYPQTDTINFNLAGSHEITLSSLFRPGTGYLERLSSLSRKELSKKLSDYTETMLEGTKPEEVNFRTWQIDKEGLVLIFPVYQVAPYVMGPQVIRLPYSELLDIIDAEGPLAPLLKQNIHNQ